VTADIGSPSNRAPGPADAILAIASNTFREAIRDRILYLLLAFALVMIVASRLLSLLTVGEESKIIKDIGLSAISVFGLLTAVFVGVSLVFKEIEKKTIYTLLAHPVRRWQFICGKYAGLLLVLAMNVGLMAVTLALLVLIRGESPVPLLAAVVLIYVELVLVTAFAILFSSFANPILAALGTAATYVVGHLTWSFDLLKARLPDGFTHALCDVLYWALPNLDRMNVKAEAVHGIEIPAGFIGAAILYGLAYAAAVIVLACVVFERRDFR
jgi:ABC-type transport system involved in multi-copper enzyme maturation permease subunit